jgi:hypothetical protein
MYLIGKSREDNLADIIPHVRFELQTPLAIKQQILSQISMMGFLSWLKPISEISHQSKVPWLAELTSLCLKFQPLSAP